MFNSIQAGRALAALLVVAYHLGGDLAHDKYFGTAADFLAQAFVSGDAGVPFFFVLSGFLITLMHMNDVGRPERLGHYLRKRVTRIYPSYLIVFTLACLGALATPALRDTVPRDAIAILKCLVLWPQDPAVVGGTGAPVLWVAWTLQYEVYFYALAALAILNRQLGKVIFGVLTVGVLVHQVSPWSSFPGTFLFYPLVMLFLFGIAAAYVFKATVWPARPGWLVALGAITIMSLMGYEVLNGVKGTSGFRQVFYGVGATALLLGLVRLEQAGAIVWRSPVVRRLGDASYALYLLHFPVMSVLCKVAAKMGLKGAFAAALSFVVIMIACVLAALVFHKLVERPILRWLSPARPPAGKAQGLPERLTDEDQEVARAA